MCAAAVTEQLSVPGFQAAATSAPIVRVDSLNHFYGHGEARNQVLFDNSIEIGPGLLGRRLGGGNVDVHGRVLLVLEETLRRVPLAR